MKIGRLTVSDRASAGIYDDRSGPEIERMLRETFGADAEYVAVIVPDDEATISARLRELADVAECGLIVTTGGTGIAARDVTPEATRAVLDRELPGFGEAMRMHSLSRVRTAILSRATA
ncbi:MAG: molybdenum cofactor synthesis domain-containing protein, partial [Limisphaerales bacterium]